MAGIEKERVIHAKTIKMWADAAPMIEPSAPYDFSGKPDVVALLTRRRHYHIEGADADGKPVAFSFTIEHPYDGGPPETSHHSDCPDVVIFNDERWVIGEAGFVRVDAHQRPDGP